MGEVYFELRDFLAAVCARGWTRCVASETLRAGPSSDHAPLAETFEARPNRLVFPGSNSCQLEGTEGTFRHFPNSKLTQCCYIEIRVWGGKLMCRILGILLWYQCLCPGLNDERGRQRGWRYTKRKLKGDKFFKWLPKLGPMGSLGKVH